jgi:hypothetical protein
MNVIDIVKKLLKPIILGFIVMIATISCDDDSMILHIIYDKWEETYYNEPGHSNKVALDSKKVILDNGSIYISIVTLDNFTKDAFDIRERFADNRSSDSLHSWVSFKYLTFSTNCREVNKDMTVFPNSIISPKWWPDDLKRSIFPRNRSKYKFYRCYAAFAGHGLSFFHYFAIDNTTKTGYYWRTLLAYTSSIGKYYYPWEEVK